MEPVPHQRPTWLGRVAVAVALLTPVLVGAGIALATGNRFAEATAVAYAAIGSSGVAILAGIVATAARWGRGPGIAAIVIGVLANPLVLIYGLGGVSRL